MEMLQIKDLNFTYPGCTRKALNNISLTIESGEMVVIFGETGCGKSTLLRMLKRELTPAGERLGSIIYNNCPLEELEDSVSACDIGFVMQKPENQIVTDKVWHELSFGLENLGLDTSVIRRRVSEMSNYFGIEDWFHKNVSELSGGQKQLLNLAAVMVMQPKVLILDEPTAQLDPIAASDFIATLHKLNQELSLTIILVEHRLEEIMPIADKAIFMDKGQVRICDTPRKTAGQLGNQEHMMSAMPCAVRLYNKFPAGKECPLTVKEGRNYIENQFSNEIRTLERKRSIQSKEIVLQGKELWFRYHKEGTDVLKGTNLTVYQNEILCILGGNASGKSTILNVLSGILRPYSGAVSLFGRRLQSYKNGTLYNGNLALLPQDVTTVFLGNTLKEDVEQKIEDLPFDIREFLDRHPYDLSGGEQQLCALAKILAQKPRVLLLDEPTKGVDAFAKQGIQKILRELKEKGVTILVVTHDIEFAAGCADRCALLFDGDIVSVDTPDLFFAENNFYTTAANRMTRNYYDNIVTVEDMIDICTRNNQKEKMGEDNANKMD